MTDPALELVTELIAAQGIPQDRIRPDASLADLLGDSLDLLPIVTALEHDLRLELPEFPDPPMETVGELADWVRRARER